MAAIFLSGCHTVYRDVYSPKRNHYKPLPEKRTEVLPPDLTPTQTTTPAIPVPDASSSSSPSISTDSLPSSSSAPAPAAPSDPTAIPGLDPIPSGGGSAMPQMAPMSGM